jgi:hypothetical protein
LVLVGFMLFMERSLAEIIISNGIDEELAVKVDKR